MRYSACIAQNISLSYLIIYCHFILNNELLFALIFKITRAASVISIKKCIESADDNPSLKTNAVSLLVVFHKSESTSQQQMSSGSVAGVRRTIYCILNIISVTHSDNLISLSFSLSLAHSHVCPFSFLFALKHIYFNILTVWKRD